MGSNYTVPAGASIDSSLNAILLPGVSSTVLQMEMGVKDKHKVCFWSLSTSLFIYCESHLAITIIYIYTDTGNIIYTYT